MVMETLFQTGPIVFHAIMVKIHRILLNIKNWHDMDYIMLLTAQYSVVQINSSMPLQVGEVLEAFGFNFHFWICRKIHSPPFSVMDMEEEATLLQ